MTKTHIKFWLRPIKIFQAVKIQKRYEDYTGRLQGGLDSECSITFVADDEDIDEVSS